MWTDKSIKSLKPRERRYRRSEDTKQRGSGRLVVDIQTNGVKTFFYQYFRMVDGKSKRVLVNIGRYKDSAKVPGYTLTEAREKALEYADISKKGDIKDKIEEDVQKEKTEAKRIKSANVTLQKVLTTYIDDKGPKLKPGTIKDYKKAMDETFSDYLDRPITEITRETIHSLYKKRSKKSVARTNNAMRVFRALYNYQRKATKLDDDTYFLRQNPYSILSELDIIQKVDRRKEFIEKDQLKAWFKAVLSLNNDLFDSGEVIKNLLLFVLFTGVRRQEAATLAIDNINLARGVFKLIDTKNNVVVDLPMSDYVLDLVSSRIEKGESKYLFPGRDMDKPIRSFKRPMEYLWKEFDHFTIHDLRRTFITVAESLDISIYTIKRLVNHKIDDSKDVTGGYVGMDIERMRAATQKVTDQILHNAGIKKKSVNVVAIKKKRA